MKFDVLILGPWQLLRSKPPTEPGDLLIAKFYIFLSIFNVPNSFINLLISSYFLFVFYLRVLSLSWLLSGEDGESGSADDPEEEAKTEKKTTELQSSTNANLDASATTTDS